MKRTTFRWVIGNSYKTCEIYEVERLWVPCPMCRAPNAITSLPPPELAKQPHYDAIELLETIARLRTHVGQLETALKGKSNE